MRSPRVPGKAPLLFALAVLLAACARQDTAPGPWLPPSGPAVIGAPPLESMAPYRRPFALRGRDPDWTASIRPGTLRLRMAGAPDKIIPLTEPVPCWVVGCEGAWFDTHERRRALEMEPGPCRLRPDGPAYPYRVALVRPGVGERDGKLTGCAWPGARPIPGPVVPRTPAPPAAPPPPLTAADARDAFDREALRALGATPAPPERPWHSGGWLREGAPGAVGRLHDLCTGAVEPRPQLSIGPWDWETLDPRRLGAADRQALLNWRVQQLASAYACGTVFVIGDLAHRAIKAAGQCPAGRRPNASEAFVAHVNRNPDLRAGGDVLSVAAAALRAAGCGA